jgi:hypothetical protein
MNSDLNYDTIWKYIIKHNLTTCFNDIQKQSLIEIGSIDSLQADSNVYSNYFAGLFVLLTYCIIFVYMNQSKIRSTSFVDYIYHKIFLCSIYGILLLPVILMFCIQRILYFCACQIHYKQIFSGFNFIIEKDSDFHQLIYMGTVPLSNEEQEPLYCNDQDTHHHH